MLVPPKETHRIPGQAGKNYWGMRVANKIIANPRLRTKFAIVREQSSIVQFRFRRSDCGLAFRTERVRAIQWLEA